MGRPPEEDPGERVSHLSSSLGKRGGQCARGVLDPDSPCTLLAKTEPWDPRTRPPCPAPVHPDPGRGPQGDWTLGGPLPPSRPDSPLCWAPPRPGRPGPCCRGGARRRASHQCRAARPGAGAAPLPDPRHNRTPAGSRTMHLQVWRSRRCQRRGGAEGCQPGGAGGAPPVPCGPGTEASYSLTSPLQLTLQVGGVGRLLPRQHEAGPLILWR